jgi:hypothetical protein
MKGTIKAILSALKRDLFQRMVVELILKKSQSLVKPLVSIMRLNSLRFLPESRGQVQLLTLLQNKEDRLLLIAKG